MRKRKIIEEKRSPSRLSDQYEFHIKVFAITPRSASLSVRLMHQFRVQTRGDMVQKCRTPTVWARLTVRGVQRCSRLRRPRAAGRGPCWTGRRHTPRAATGAIGRACFEFWKDTADTPTSMHGPKGLNPTMQHARHTKPSWSMDHDLHVRVNASEPGRESGVKWSASKCARS